MSNKKSEYYKMFEELNEVKKQNEELIKFLIKKYIQFSDINSMPNLNNDFKILLEKIKQKPIEEILKEKGQRYEQEKKTIKSK
jgi:hypothetical protein